METQGIAVQMDQMTQSVDSAISFIEELFQNHSVIGGNVTV
jgi:centromeric protein E